MSSEAGTWGGRARVAVAVTAAAVAVTVAVAWVVRRGGPKPDAGSAPVPPPGTVVLSPAAMKEAGLRVEAASAATVRDTIDAPGVLALDERHTARIGSQVEGKVVEVLVEIGDRVAAGRELARMISPVVHEAWASYRKAVVERRRAEAALKLAVQQEERVKRLYADKAVPLQELQRAAADRASAEDSLAVAGIELRRAQEAMEHLGITNAEDPAGESGEQIPVRSPLAGVVLERQVTEGGAVTAGSPLFVVSDLSSLWALAEIDETVLPHISTRQPVEVRVAAYPTERFAGTVSWVADVVNPKTRRVTVRCEVPNPDGRLKPDMYATVTLAASDEHPVVVVPAAAVVEIDGRAALFVETAPGRFARRDVVTGPEREGRVQVRSGLAPGDRVVVAGAFLLKSELLKPATPEG
jgi:cobalt-zinc-cadmium efflux system membrane fusion protein